MLREGRKCVIYVRVSTENQVDGFSLDAQKNVLKRYADREGMIVKEIYEDAGKSGKSIEGRPAFKQMLLDISNGLQIDYILVYKLSRFGRNAADILNSIEFIQSYDINLIATEEGIDSSQNSGKLMISILSAMAEIERENILEQTMNGRREKARQGGWNGGFAPYGYILDKGEFTVVEGEAEIVNRIFNMYVVDNMPIGGIARQLNLEGVRRSVAHNRKIERWGRNSVKNILGNPFYCGTIAFGRRKKEKIKGTRNDYQRVKTNDYITSVGKHQAIVSKEIWDKANAKLIKSAKKTTAQPFKRTYLLSGLLKCPKCGGPLFAQKNSWTLYDGTIQEHCFYRCSNAYSDNGHKCDNRMRINQEETDNYIVNTVKGYINNGAIAAEIDKRAGNGSDTSQYDQELKNYNRKLNQTLLNKSNLENEIDNMPIEVPHRDKKIADLNKRLYSLYDVIDELEDNISDVKMKIEGIKNKDLTYAKALDLLESFNDLYDEMEAEEQLKMLNLLIDEIRFNGDNKIAEIEFSIKIECNTSKVEQQALNKSSVQTVRFIMKIENPTLEMKNFDPKTERRARYTKHITKYADGTSRKPGRPKKNEPHQFKTSTEIINGEEVEVHYYSKSKHIVKKRAEHYNRKQATYAQIKEYILNKYDIKVHSVYISEVKRLHGVDMQANRRKEDTERCSCPADKVLMIEDALRYFNIIS